MRRTEGMASAAGRVHSRHVLHVSHTPGSRSNTSLGRPAAFKILCMDAALACHHLRWSFLSIRRRPPSEASLSPRSDCGCQNVTSLWA
eukprot:4494992-Amphidinium_carterae.1